MDSARHLGRRLLLILLFVAPSIAVQAQHSVARLWNEQLLEAIRNDFARPTVHARNLFHTSAVMYDAWAAFDDVAQTFLLGKRVGGFSCTASGFPPPADRNAARDEAISYAAYTLLSHRFQNSPGAAESLAGFDALMIALGYDPALSSTDYVSGSAAALGNYIARCMIDLGFQDGSNELDAYEYKHYEPVNPPLLVTAPGNPDIVDLNRWQPLKFVTFIDQGGNLIPGSTPKFLGPEWGVVTPFALSQEDLTIYRRDDGEYWVYHDPGPPPFIEPETGGGLSAEYQWGFALVAAWSSHLDPADDVMWDVSPRSIGNVPEYPARIEDYRSFYDLEEGGDTSLGHEINPRTGLPYEEQWVPRGDYARVLAEFWADGPHSETPPGHWFTILNYVSDHPRFVRKYRGEGPIVDPLEWDVKAYLTLGGAVHDAAVTVWGMKGWYDYIRPISAIRAMADRGQSSDPSLPNYSVSGIPLVDGFIELVQPGDSLAGESGENVNKIKLKAWRGHPVIEDPETETAGVDWVLAENWWPYQRLTFVTPPFAGYISGHSTFSSAAAEVLTLLTGDPYFPGGMGEFKAEKNEYLVFEEGPSVDVTLQWATYRDASDQTSLSRIWGGIHPPADDIPGRLIGLEIGRDAIDLADGYFTGATTDVEKLDFDRLPFAADVFPNPVRSGMDANVLLKSQASEVSIRMYNMLGQTVWAGRESSVYPGVKIAIPTSGLASGVYMITLESGGSASTRSFLLMR